VIRIAEIAPESDEIRNLPAQKSRELFKSMGHEGASTYGRGGRHPMMHRSESIDYVVVLEGEITLLLDDQDVQLKAGDVVVQRGTNHAWSNRSGKMARMLYLLIDGYYDPELAALLGHQPSADEVR
jgi:mannose-6-phosphate isomerase-like protein (cupin superfamily)